MRRLLVPVLFAAALASAARAAVEFIGVFTTSTGSAFALTEQTGKPATWHALGEVFSGYTLEAFDAKSDTLTLRKNDQAIRLRLKDDAKVKSSRVELRGELKIGGTGKIEISRATLIFDQENVFPLAGGLVFRVTPSRLPDGNIRYDATFEQTGADGKVDRLAAPRLITLPGQPFGIQIGDLGFAFSPAPI